MEVDFVFVALGFAALFAGFVDSIVGGGGLIQLPALLTAPRPGFDADIYAILSKHAGQLTSLEARS